jgi:hypothetical protein
MATAYAHIAKLLHAVVQVLSVSTAVDRLALGAMRVLHDPLG